MNFKKGDILSINPKPCPENRMATDNYIYLKEHFREVRSSSLFIVVDVDEDRKDMVYVRCVDDITCKQDSTYASRFVLYKKPSIFNEDLFTV